MSIEVHESGADLTAVCHGTAKSTTRKSHRAARGKHKKGGRKGRMKVKPKHTVTKSSAGDIWCDADDGNTSYIDRLAPLLIYS